MGRGVNQARLRHSWYEVTIPNCRKIRNRVSLHFGIVNSAIGSSRQFQETLDNSAKGKDIGDLAKMTLIRPFQTTEEDFWPSVHRTSSPQSVPLGKRQSDRTTQPRKDSIERDEIAK